MRGAAVHDDFEATRTFPCRLQRAAVGRWLDHQHGTARPCPRLDQGARRSRPDLFVGREQHLDTRSIVQRRDGVNGLHDAGLHVEHTGTGGPPIDDRKRSRAQRTQREHGVVVTDDQDTRGLIGAPVNMRPRRPWDDRRA